MASLPSLMSLAGLLLLAGTGPARGRIRSAEPAPKARGWEYRSLDFTYDSHNLLRPWRMVAPEGRLGLIFTPFLERVAATNLLVIASEVHEVFGRYDGTVRTEDGGTLRLDGLVGWAEEHLARR